MQWMQVQNCGDVALGRDQCAMHWKVVQEFSVHVSLPTSAIHLLMILGKSLHLSVLLFMLQTFWCKGTLLVHLHSANACAILVGLLPGACVIYIIIIGSCKLV